MHSNGQNDEQDNEYTEPLELVQRIFHSAERILSSDSPVAVQFTDLEQISEAGRRNLLLRATLADPPPHLPRTLIIKQVITETYDPNYINPNATEAWDTRRFFQDWLGAALLTQCAPTASHAPHFYGGDRANGFILMEDMGEQHGSLVEPLLSNDPDKAKYALLHFVERLANIHVATHGQRTAYDTLAATLNPHLVTELRKAHNFEERLANTSLQLAAIDVEVSSAAQRELDALAHTLTDPGPFTAFCHGDPCPDNFFWQGQTLRIMDFEFGNMGHALMDLAFGRMIFPTCWCCNRIPAEIVEAMETRYRQIFAQVYPSILDDIIFGKAMAEVCAVTLIFTLDWLLGPALDEDREWGIATLRPRILARLEAFIAASLQFDQLPATCNLAETLLALLQERWADVEPLPLYPAFREQRSNAE